MTMVVGFFDSWDKADRAVRNLIADGAPSDQISVVTLESTRGGGGAAAERSADPHGAEGGATAGAVLGGAAGIALGLGALAIPGVGPLLAAGPLIAALAGGAVGAAAGGVAGGLLGALVDAGVPKDRAERYVEGVRKGGVLVTLRAIDLSSAPRAERILRDAGAVDVDTGGGRQDTSAASGALS
jgi:hypothetical protein